MERVLNKVLKMRSLLFIGSAFLLSCTNHQDTSTKKNISVMDTTSSQHTETAKVLAKQLENGSSMEFAATEYGKPDFVEAANAAGNILRKNGYVAKDDFIAKLKSVFGSQDFKEGELNALSYQTGCLQDKKIYAVDESGSSSYLYVDLKNKLITDFHPLPLLINYEKDYPAQAEIEKNPIKVHDAVEGSDFEVTRWKDFPKLSVERQQNVQKIISRNKYLFDGSKAEFSWLKNNDQNFLVKLVTVFGYVKDKDLDRWVLDRNVIQPNKDNEDVFGGVLWNKKCDGNVVVHTEIFDFVKAETNDTNVKYLNSLADYIIYLRDKDKNLPFAQRAEILAKVAYYAQKIVNGNEKKFEQDYYTKFMFPLIQVLQSKELLEPEFKKHNYYGLPGFKELWEEQVDYNGGVGMAM